MIDTQSLINACYYLASFLFILALGGLSHQESARKGNWYGVFGMGLAIIITYLVPGFGFLALIKFLIAFAIGGVIGALLGSKVQMISMPQMVAALHSFVGIAATIIGFANYGKIYGYTEGSVTNEEEASTQVLVEIYLGIFIGAITFSGSVIACGKLNGNIGSAPLILGGAFRHWLNLFLIIISCVMLVFFVLTTNQMYMHIMCALALFLGWHLIMAIGGADMPVVVSMLNSYSGWATSASGFMIKNDLLIISGALIGSSGAILSYIMCKAMNRGFFSVIMGGFGIETDLQQNIEGEMVEAQTKEVVDDLQNAKSVVIIPGYGMAVAKAQNQVGALVDALRKMGKTARFCIHPVAGRLPGHMNVLLAEANVPYDIVLEKDEINDDFPKTDVVIVIGANDIVNPDALTNPKSPIAGMPVCECWKAKKVYIIKRGKGKGYAAIENPLFYEKNSRMYYGNADKQVQNMLDELNKRGLTSGGPVVVKKQEKVQIEEEDLEILTPPSNPPKIISIPKEVNEGERRIAMVPKVCRQLVKLGFGIAIETNAGLEAGFTDKDFENAGCIIKTTENLWKEADILIKINEPTFNPTLGKHEADALTNASILISFVWPIQNKDLVTKLQQHKQLTTLAVDQTPRITRAQKLDVRSSQMNLIGYKAALLGFNNLPRFSKQVITAAGKFQPARVFIIGCGVAGLAAIGMAKSMGAIVKAFDSRSEVKEQIESMGATFVEIDFEEEGAGGGGYAKQMSAAYYQAQEKMNEEVCKESDIVITTALIPGKKAPILVTKKVVQTMKPGSVIVDIAASQGGNCELTRKGQIHQDPQTGVIIVGVTDSEISSSMASTASELFAVNMGFLLDEMIQRPLNKNNTAQNFTLDLNDEIVRGMAITHKGEFIYIAPQPPKPQQQQQQQQENKKVEIKQDQAVINMGQQKDSQGKYFALEDQKNASSESCCETPLCGSLRLFIYGFIFTALVGIFTNLSFVGTFGTFILAIFIGYLVIWNVTPALHTPLMAETNAISGIIVIGCMQVMMQLGEKSLMTTYSLLAFIGLFFASINVVGGFVVTHRMLGMFHK